MTSHEVSRRTVESVGAEWVSRKWESMEGRDSSLIPIMNLKNYDRAHLQSLNIGQEGFAFRPRFGADLYYHPFTGAVYSTTWRNKETIIDVENQTRSIKNPENYTNLPSRFEPEALESIIGKGRVIELLPSKVWQGMEDAIRQQKHILQRYEPGHKDAEPHELRKIIHWIDTTARSFREIKITDEHLEQFAREAVEHVDTSGLISPVDETKKILKERLMSASQRDSLNRTNPLVTRVRLRSALLAATQRLKVAEFVTRKFSANLGVLTLEREYTRYFLEKADQELSVVQGRLNTPSVSDWEYEGLASRVEQTALEYLSLPRVAPYLLPARLSAVFLKGCRDEWKETNRQVLGDEIADEIFSLPPATELIRERNLFSASRNISWVREMLAETLHNPDNNNLG